MQTSDSAPSTTRRLLLVAAAALMDSSGRVLITQRPAHKQLGGLWEFPGGKVELGEAPEQALVRELKEELDRIFVKNEEYSSLMINILSFGFKHGIPADADLVFDVRFLPNPFYIDELKYLTGNDRGVQDYVMSFPEAGIFLDKLTDLLRFLIPNYIKEGKYQLVVAIGCTGGKHRSVTLANELYRKLRNMEAKYGVSLSHRDI